MTTYMVSTGSEKINIVPVDFRNVRLIMLGKDDEPYVAMKPIVEGMGLDWSTQLRKLSSSADRWGIVITPIVLNNVSQSVTCMKMSKLAGWLMSINPSKVKASIRDAVIAYQNECDQILWDHWSQKFGKTAEQKKAKEDEEQKRWLALRDQSKGGRKEFAQTLAEHGVAGRGFAECTNAIYKPILGGTAKQLRAKNHLKAADSIRDRLPGKQLAAVWLAEEMSRDEIEDKDVQGLRGCRATCYDSATRVSKALVVT